jgi:pimeloyl-ACP methyl ester carboxylesterase
MPYARNGAVRLYYEVLGDAAEPVLMIAGAGRQGTDFDEVFCARLVGAGFRPIRYDQRDVGFSTAFTDRPARVAETYDDLVAGRPSALVYDVDDMAADAFAILEAEGIGSAHVIGRSLGSLTAQVMALERPAACLSLTLVIAFSRSLVSTMTRDRLERLDAEVLADADAYVRRQVLTAKTIGSPGSFDEAATEAAARLAFGRGVHLGAAARHFAVGLAAPDLRPRLGGLTTPTQIVHGALDPVISLAFARETAAAIPGARLDVFEDMAHDIPRARHREIVGLFAANAVRSRV